MDRTRLHRSRPKSAEFVRYPPTFGSKAYLHLSVISARMFLRNEGRCRFPESADFQLAATPVNPGFILRIPKASLAPANAVGVREIERRGTR